MTQPLIPSGIANYKGTCCTQYCSNMMFVLQNILIAL